MCGAEAASFTVREQFFPLRTSDAAAPELYLSLGDGTQRKGPCDWLKDDGTRSFGDRATPTHIKPDERRNVFEAVFLKLKQLP